MEANLLKDATDRAYAERMDARMVSVRDEVAAIPAHPYDDWTVDDYIDPTFYTGLVTGKSGKYLNFKRR